MNAPQAGATSEASNLNQTDRWLAAGGVLGAILASTCCIVPLLLVTIGVSGAWIGNLAALEPYSIYFTIAALVFVGLGFWHAYIRKSAECARGSSCAGSGSRIAKFALWAAALLLLVNMTMSWWAPLFY